MGNVLQGARVMYTCFKGYIDDITAIMKGGNYLTYQECLREANRAIESGFDYVDIVLVDDHRVTTIVTLRMQY